MVSGQLHALAGLPRCRGPPPIRQSQSGGVQYRESELQTTDHEMILAGGGSGGGSIWRVDGVSLYRGDCWTAVDG